MAQRQPGKHEVMKKPHVPEKKKRNKEKETKKKTSRMGYIAGV